MVVLKALITCTTRFYSGQGLPAFFPRVLLYVHCELRVLVACVEHLPNGFVPSVGAFFSSSAPSLFSSGHFLLYRERHKACRLVSYHIIAYARHSQPRVRQFFFQRAQVTVLLTQRGNVTHPSLMLTELLVERTHVYEVLTSLLVVLTAPHGDQSFSILLIYFRWLHEVVSLRRPWQPQGRWCQMHNIRSHPRRCSHSRLS